MSFWTVLGIGVTYFFKALVEWMYIFISPIKNFNVFWILIPIWASWFFAEFFQEKKGTSFGNAITNGVVPLFVGLDWTRHITNQIITNKLPFSWGIFAKYTICLFAFLYGFSIIYFGIKGKQWIHFYGRIREVTYVFVVFSPVIYGIIPLSFRFIILVFAFFPVYYYLIEFIAMYTPDSEVLKEDMGKVKNDEFGSLNNPLTQDPFASSNSSNSLGSLDDDFGKEFKF
ncbi:MAG: hypothetical protein PHU51_04495 [Candidatus Nanoarchaeia archaeon]|nr:hypothetical protein [Candidatus Nanoarchaeia archaeon]